ncbi:MAG TPA: DUF2892 domain-containing protein [Gemmatimonadaceae bacterium]|nr:DUF2892 domain-containing protein [Gemmatimonadaceae bacterium]
MNQNIGDADRAGRMLLGSSLSIAYFAIPRSVVSDVVGVIAVVLLLTSLVGWSPLYFVLRRSTRSDKDAKPLPPP